MKLVDCEGSIHKASANKNAILVFAFLNRPYICYLECPAGTERRPNQSWTNIISVQGWTNPES